MGIQWVTVDLIRFFLFVHLSIYLLSRKEYSDRLTLTNHKNFVSSVCVLDGGEWICTGSNDATICVYVAGNVEPFTTLRSHTSTGMRILQFFVSSISQMNILYKIILNTCN